MRLFEVTLVCYLLFLGLGVVWGDFGLVVFARVGLRSVCAYISGFEMSVWGCRAELAILVFWVLVALRLDGVCWRFDLFSFGVLLSYF